MMPYMYGPVPTAPPVVTVPSAASSQMLTTTAATASRPAFAVHQQNDFAPPWHSGWRSNTVQQPSPWTTQVSSFASSSQYFYAMPYRYADGVPFTAQLPPSRMTTSAAVAAVETSRPPTLWDKRDAPPPNSTTAWPSLSRHDTGDHARMAAAGKYMLPFLARVCAAAPARRRTCAVLLRAPNIMCTVCPCRARSSPRQRARRTQQRHSLPVAAYTALCLQRTRDRQGSYARLRTTTSHRSPQRRQPPTKTPRCPRLPSPRHETTPRTRRRCSPRAHPQHRDDCALRSLFLHDMDGDARGCRRDHTIDATAVRGTRSRRLPAHRRHYASTPSSKHKHLHDGLTHAVTAPHVSADASSRYT
jgi:hypothetical protein